MLEVGLGISLLQVRDGVQVARNDAPNNTVLCPIAFANKSLINVDISYSNIKREVLGILHGLEKFCHFCFAHEVNMIIDHKVLIAIFKKFVASLSQASKNTTSDMPVQHQNTIQTKAQLFITDCLSRHNYKTVTKKYQACA